MMGVYVPLITLIKSLPVKLLEFSCVIAQVGGSVIVYLIKTLTFNLKRDQRIKLDRSLHF